MNNIILVFIFIILIIIYLIFLNCIYENFSNSTGTSINNTSEIAIKKLKEFDYNKYKKYIDKYFTPINFKDLTKIPVQENGLIFCSVASYRDLQCPLTVMDMIKKSKNPEKLVICICQQNAQSDIDCFNNQDYLPAKVKFIKLSDRDARGPCWARYLIQQQWNGEQYFLQIDSHMRFEQNWDEKCLNDLKNLPLKSCLSNYVSNYNLKEGKPDEKNQLRGGLFIVNNEPSKIDGFFRINSNFVNSIDKPIEGRGWAACFSFSNSKIIHDAPYDPYTPHLFFGEEMDIYARMFTRGWKVYAPTKPICYTSFDRSYRPTFWENPEQKPCEYLSRLRLYYRFGYLNNIHEQLKTDMDYYSLGKEKTWKQFIEYCLNKNII
jgi:[Skp1-protein]-hydroxyproline N-acetylglucosaminyltransferase